MRTSLTITIWLMCLLCLMIGISEAQVVTTSPNVVILYGSGAEPAIAKMPSFAYLQCRPLEKSDKILDARRFTATGKDVYEKVIQYAQENYLKTTWNPGRTRMLVLVTNRNRAFSTSGSISGSWNNSESENQALSGLSKSISSSLNASGSIAPSFSQTWISQKFDLWFFLVEKEGEK